MASDKRESAAGQRARFDLRMLFEVMGLLIFAIVATLLVVKTRSVKHDAETRLALPEAVRCSAPRPGLLVASELADAVEVTVGGGKVRRLGPGGWNERALKSEDREIPAGDRAETLEALRSALSPWKSFSLEECLVGADAQAESCEITWRQEAATGAEFVSLLDQFLSRPFCLSEATWSGESMTAVIRGRIEVKRG